MKYIIMCGCNPKQERPKHLIVIDGEEIIARTIRLLQENGIDDICLTTAHPAFKKFGLPILTHDNPFYTSGRYWVDGFYPTSEPVCYIMGDVFFSPEAIRRIVEVETDDVQFFASSPPFGKYYPKQYAEPFAFKVCNQEHFQSAIKEVRRLCDAGKFGRHPIAWELWQVVKGTQINNIIFNNYCEINDYTCDIDSESEINQWRMKK